MSAWSNAAHSRPVPDDFSLIRLTGLLMVADIHKTVVRHDVDFSLDAALAMADWERRHSIRSTYFLNPRCDHYNIFGRDGRKLLMALYQYEHEVGVHVDLGLGRDAEVSDDTIADICERDWHLLTHACAPVARKVSLHCPPHSALWRDIRGFESMSAPKWKDRYVADSRGAFLHQKPETVLVEEGWQLSLHPEWWFLPPAERARLHAQEMAAP